MLSYGPATGFVTLGWYQIIPADQVKANNLCNLPNITYTPGTLGPVTYDCPFTLF